MQTSWNRKKSIPLTSEFLHELHFAICPYMIELSQNLNYIFTLNFQKDNQIVGQLSTMIYPERNIYKIDVQAMKNIMGFRMYKDKKLNYKWTLYQRSQNGKEKLIDTVKVSLQQAIQQFMSQLHTSREPVTRGKSYESISLSSKAMNSSSKINQSIHSPRSSNKNPRPTLLQKNSSQKLAGLNESNQNSSSLWMKFYKPMKSKFLKEKVQIHFLFCIGLSEQEITQTVKQYHLEDKFSMIGMSLGKDSSKKQNKDQSKQHNKQSLELIQEELQQSHRTLGQANEKQINSNENNPPIYNQLTLELQTQTRVHSNKEQNPNKPLLKQEQLIKALQNIQRVQSEKQKVQEKHIDQQIPQVPLKPALKSVQKQPKPVALAQSGDQGSQTSSQTPKAKTQLSKQALSTQLQAKQKSTPLQQKKQTLFKTQKPPKRIIFNLENQNIQQPAKVQPQKSQKEELNHTSPEIIFGSEHNHTQRDPTIHITNANDNSALKLDDVILHGKRISVSDKSEWMKTSKSRTEQYSQTSNKGKIFSTKLNRNPNDSLKNLQLNSKPDDDKSLDLFSLKQKPETTKQKQKVQQEDEFIGEKNQQMNTPSKLQSRPQNMVKLSTLHPTNDFVKLKRKSTAQDFHKIDPMCELSNKPKTMEQTTIRKQLKALHPQLNQQDWKQEDYMEEEEQQQRLSAKTPLFGEKKRADEKFDEGYVKSGKKIPSMIDQAVEISKSNDVSRTNSANENNDPFNLGLLQGDQNNMLWGQGLSEITPQPTIQILPAVNVPQNTFYSRIQAIASPYVQQYLTPIQRKISDNPYYKNTNQLIQTNIKVKYGIIFIVILIITLLSLSYLEVFQEQIREMSKDDPIFKKKNVKTKKTYKMAKSK